MKKSTEKAQLVTTTNTIDPTVTKTAQDIAETVSEVNKLPVEPNKIVKLVGRQRIQKECNTDEFCKKLENLNAVENEAQDDTFLPHEVFTKIQELARSNPITNELLEEAKKFTSENKESIKKQFQDLVAFYNIAHNKAFFYITAAEARLAIDYIKKCRDGHIEYLKEQEQMDEKIRQFIKGLPNIKLSEKPISMSSFRETVDKDIDKICGIEMNEEINGIMYHRNMKYDVVEGFKQTVNINTGFNPSIKQKLDEVDKITEGVPTIYNTIPDGEEMYRSYLDLNWINYVFSNVEGCDLTVDAIIMNSTRIADIRSFGQSVYTQYSRREYLKRKCFGNIFGAEIYTCNALKNNQIILVSLQHYPMFVNVNMNVQK